MKVVSHTRNLIVVCTALLAVSLSLCGGVQAQGQQGSGGMCPPQGNGTADCAGGCQALLSPYKACDNSTCGRFTQGSDVPKWLMPQSGGQFQLASHMGYCLVRAKNSDTSMLLTPTNFTGGMISFTLYPKIGGAALSWPNQGFELRMFNDSVMVEFRWKDNTVAFAEAGANPVPRIVSSLVDYNGTNVPASPSGPANVSIAFTGLGSTKVLELYFENVRVMRVPLDGYTFPDYYHWLRFFDVDTHVTNVAYSTTPQAPQFPYATVQRDYIVDQNFTSQVAGGFTGLLVRVGSDFAIDNVDGEIGVQCQSGGAALASMIFGDGELTDVMAVVQFSAGNGGKAARADKAQVFVRNQMSVQTAAVDAIGARIWKLGDTGTNPDFLVCLGKVTHNMDDYMSNCRYVAPADGLYLRLVARGQHFSVIVGPNENMQVLLEYTGSAGSYDKGSVGFTLAGSGLANVQRARVARFSAINVGSGSLMGAHVDSLSLYGEDEVWKMPMTNSDSWNRAFTARAITALGGDQARLQIDAGDPQKLKNTAGFTDPAGVYVQFGPDAVKSATLRINVRNMPTGPSISPDPLVEIGVRTSKDGLYGVFFRVQCVISNKYHAYWQVRTPAGNKTSNLVNLDDTSKTVFRIDFSGNTFEAMQAGGLSGPYARISSLRSTAYATGACIMRIRDPLQVQEVFLTNTAHGGNPVSGPTEQLSLDPFDRLYFLQLLGVTPSSSLDAWRKVTNNSVSYLQSPGSDSCMTMGSDLGAVDMEFYLPYRNSLTVGLFANGCEEDSDLVAQVVIQHTGSTSGSVCFQESINTSAVNVEVSRSSSCVSLADANMYKDKESHVNVVSDGKMVLVSINSVLVSNFSLTTLSQFGNNFKAVGAPFVRALAQPTFPYSAIKGPLIVKTETPAMIYAWPPALERPYKLLSLVYDPASGNLPLGNPVPASRTKDWDVQSITNNGVTTGQLRLRINGTERALGEAAVMGFGHQSLKEYAVRSTLVATSNQTGFVVVVGASASCQEGLVTEVNLQEGRVRVWMRVGGVSMPVIVDEPYKRHVNTPPNTPAVSVLFHVTDGRVTLTNSAQVLVWNTTMQLPGSGVCIGGNTTNTSQTVDVRVNNLDLFCGTYTVFGEPTQQGTVGSVGQFDVVAHNSYGQCNTSLPEYVEVALFNVSQEKTQWTQTLPIVAIETLSSVVPRRYRLQYQLPTTTGTHKVGLLVESLVDIVTVQTIVGAVNETLTSVVSTLAPNSIAGVAVGGVARFQLRDIYGNPLDAPVSGSTFTSLNPKLEVTSASEQVIVSGTQDNGHVVFPAPVLLKTGLHTVVLKMGGSVVPVNLPSVQVSPNVAVGSTSYVYSNVSEVPPVARAGAELNPFVVHLRDAFGNVVSLQHPSELPANTYAELVGVAGNRTLDGGINHGAQNDAGEGVAVAGFKRTVAGNYMLRIVINGTEVQNGTLPVIVAPLEIAAAETSAALAPAIGETVAGTEVETKLVLRDKYGNRLASASSYIALANRFVPELYRFTPVLPGTPDDSVATEYFQVTPQVQGLANGTVRLSYVPLNSTGAWKMKAQTTVNGTTVYMVGYPMFFRVVPAAAQVNTSTMQYYNLPLTRDAGELIEAELVWRDKFGNRRNTTQGAPGMPAVKLSSGVPVNYTVSDMGEGVLLYRVNITRAVTGVNLVFELDGQTPQQGSVPVTIKAETSDEREWLVTGGGTDRCEVGVENFVVLVPRDSYGNALSVNAGTAESTLVISRLVLEVTRVSDGHVHVFSGAYVATSVELGQDVVVLKYRVNRTLDHTVRVMRNTSAGVFEPVGALSVSGKTLHCNAAPYVPSQTLVMQIEREATAGVPFTPVLLQLRDEFGNNVTNSSVAVEEDFTGQLANEPDCKWYRVVGPQAGLLGLRCNLTRSTLSDTARTDEPQGSEYIVMTIRHGVEVVATLADSVRVVPGPAVALLSSVTGGNTTLAANQTSSVLLCKARDAFGNRAPPGALFSVGVESGPSEFEFWVESDPGLVGVSIAGQRLFYKAWRRGAYTVRVYLGGVYTGVEANLEFRSTGLSNAKQSEVLNVTREVTADQTVNLWVVSRDVFGNRVLMEEAQESQPLISFVDWNDGTVVRVFFNETKFISAGNAVFGFEIPVRRAGEYRMNFTLGPPSGGNIAGPPEKGNWVNVTVAPGVANETTTEMSLRFSNPGGAGGGGGGGDAGKLEWSAGSPIGGLARMRDRYGNVVKYTNGGVVPFQRPYRTSNGLAAQTATAINVTVDGSGLLQGNTTLTQVGEYNMVQGLFYPLMNAAIVVRQQTIEVVGARADGGHSVLHLNTQVNRSVDALVTLNVTVGDLFGNPFRANGQIVFRAIARNAAMTEVNETITTGSTTSNYLLPMRVRVAGVYDLSVSVRDGATGVVTEFADTPVTFRMLPGVPSTAEFTQRWSGYRSVPTVGTAVAVAGVENVHEVEIRDQFGNSIEAVSGMATQLRVTVPAIGGGTGAETTFFVAAVRSVVNGAVVETMRWSWPKVGSARVAMDFRGEGPPDGKFDPMGVLGRAPNNGLEVAIVNNELNATMSVIVGNQLSNGLVAGATEAQMVSLVSRDAYGNVRTEGTDVFRVRYSLPSRNVTKTLTTTAQTTVGVYNMVATDLTVAGRYTVTVEADIKGTFEQVGTAGQLVVSPDLARAAQSFVDLVAVPREERWMQAVTYSVDAGKTGEAYVQARDQFGNKRTVGGETFRARALVDGKVLPVAVYDLGTGVYKMNHTYTVAGSYSIQVSFNTPTNPVQNSPMVLTMLPEPVPHVPGTTVSGLDTDLVAGGTRTVVVSTFDRFGNALDLATGRVRVEFAYQQTAAVTAAGAGGRSLLESGEEKMQPWSVVHNEVFGQTRAGRYSVRVFVDNIEYVAGGSLSLQVVPGAVLPRKCNVSGPGLVSVKNTPSELRVSGAHQFVLQAIDAFDNKLTSTGTVGDFQVRFTAVVDGAQVVVTPSDTQLGINNGQYTFTYQVARAQQYSLVIKYQGTEDVLAEPLTVSIYADCPAGTARTVDFVCTDCASNSYTNSSNEDACTVCPAGSAAPAKSTALGDCSCNVGFFRPAAAEANTACQPCPAGGKCDGGAAQPVAAAGFWATSGGQAGLQFLKCTNAEACPGGSSEATCGTGYTGRLCGLCAKRYYKIQNTCRPCGDDSTLVFSIAMSMLVLFAFGVRKFGAEAKKLSFLGIATNNLQLMALLGSFELQWPDQVVVLFDLISTFNFNVEITSPECVVDVSYWDKWYLKLVAPWIMVATLCMVQAMVSAMDALRIEYRMWRKRVKQRRLGADDSVFPMFNYDFRAIWMKNWDSTYNAIMLFMALVYALVTPTALEMFVCTEQADGTFSLDASPSIECFNSDWYAALPVTVAAVIVYGLGIPGFLFWRLYANRDRLETERLERRMGSVYLRYKKKFYFWEVVLVLRKGLVFMCRVIFGESVVFQVVAAFLMILFCLEFQLYARPFATGGANILEFASLMSSLFLLLTGLLFWGDKLDPATVGGRASLEAVIVLAVVAITFNVITLAVGLYYHFRSRRVQTISREKRKQLHQQIERTERKAVNTTRMRYNTLVDGNEGLLRDQDVHEVADMIMNTEEMDAEMFARIQSILEEDEEEEVAAAGVVQGETETATDKPWTGSVRMKRGMTLTPRQRGASVYMNNGGQGTGVAAGKVGSVRVKRGMTLTPRQRGATVHRANASPGTSATLSKRRLTMGKQAMEETGDLIELDVVEGVDQDHLDDIAEFYRGLLGEDEEERTEEGGTTAASSEEKGAQSALIGLFDLRAPETKGPQALEEERERLAQEKRERRKSRKMERREKEGKKKKRKKRLDDVEDGEGDEEEEEAEV